MRDPLKDKTQQAVAADPRDNIVVSTPERPVASVVDGAAVKAAFDEASREAAEARADEEAKQHKEFKLSVDLEQYVFNNFVTRTVTRKYMKFTVRTLLARESDMIYATIDVPQNSTMMHLNSKIRLHWAALCLVDLQVNGKSMVKLPNKDDFKKDSGATDESKYYEARLKAMENMSGAIIDIVYMEFQKLTNDLMSALQYEELEDNLKK